MSPALRLVQSSKAAAVLAHKQPSDRRRVQAGGRLSSQFVRRSYAQYLPRQSDRNQFCSHSLSVAYPLPHRNRNASARSSTITAALVEESDHSVPIQDKPVVNMPPPYARLSVPVYSIATAPTDENRGTMNITTYATPVAISPARRFVVALYKGTLTAENMMASGTGVLQILGEQHGCLVPLLGKTAGREVDKAAELQEMGRGLREWRGVQVLDDALGLVELRIASLQDAGDHHLALCDVASHEDAASSMPSSAHPLYTGWLKQNGLM